MKGGDRQFHLVKFVVHMHKMMRIYTAIKNTRISQLGVKLKGCNVRFISSDSSHKSHKDIPERSWPIGPGAPPGVIPTPFEQAVGVERLEYLAEAEGVSVFLTDEALEIKARGTLEKPVLVPSICGERFVGCTGFPKYSHNVLWLELLGFENPERCPDCGQAFKLTPAVMPPYNAPSVKSN